MRERNLKLMSKQAIHFVPPDPTLAADFNITYDIEAAWGQDEDTHVYASYPGGLNSTISKSERINPITVAR